MEFTLSELIYLRRGVISDIVQSEEIEECDFLKALLSKLGDGLHSAYKKLGKTPIQSKLELENTNDDFRQRLKDAGVEILKDDLAIFDENGLVNNILWLGYKGEITMVVVNLENIDKTIQEVNSDFGIII